MEKKNQTIELASHKPANRVVQAIAKEAAAIKEATEQAVPKSVVSPPSEIVYTQTRSVQLDATHLERNRIISGLEEQENETYKMLRTRVLHRMRLNNWRTLAITSPREGAGKTVTAINLAISLAREVNQTVLLVDLDLRQPSVREYLTPEPLQGIGEYLLDDVPLNELLFNPKGIDRLVVLPGSVKFQHSSEILSSPKVVALADELKSRYSSRLVLFDLPPVLSCDDVLAFSPYFDATLLVVEENVSTKEDIVRSAQLMQQTNLLGTVLNKASIADAGYY